MSISINDNDIRFGPRSDYSQCFKPSKVNIDWDKINVEGVRKLIKEYNELKDKVVCLHCGQQIPTDVISVQRLNELKELLGDLVI